MASKFLVQKISIKKYPGLYPEKNDFLTHPSAIGKARNYLKQPVLAKSTEWRIHVSISVRNSPRPILLSAAEVTVVYHRSKGFHHFLRVMARTPLFHSYHGISCLNSIKINKVSVVPECLTALRKKVETCWHKLAQVANPATSTDCPECPMEIHGVSGIKPSQTSVRNIWVCLLKLGTELNSVVCQFII